MLYEDDWLLAIDKPAGLVAHPTRRLSDRNPRQCAALAQRRSAPTASVVGPRLVHRLDRETSGVLLVAKSREVHAALARAMGRRAVSEGVPRAGLRHAAARSRSDRPAHRPRSGHAAAGGVGDRGRACSTQLRAARAVERRARRALAAALHARHGPPAPDPRAPVGDRSAARRRSALRRAAMEGHRRGALRARPARRFRDRRCTRRDCGSPIR